MAARQESVMANADEPFGQHMEEEPSDKLVRRQPHHLGTMVIRIILPAERHLAVLQRQQARIGKGHAVGIAAEIAKYLLGSAEGSLGVDDPVFTVQGIEPTAKDLRTVAEGPRKH